MNKKRYISFLRGELKGKSLEQKVHDLYKLKNSDWIDEYLNKLLKNYTYCSSCEKYSKTSKCKTVVENKFEQGVQTFRDAGYGDDDEYSDVTYSVLYRICPHCKGKEAINKTILKIHATYDRYNNKIR